MNKGWVIRRNIEECLEKLMFIVLSIVWLCFGVGMTVLIWLALTGKLYIKQDCCPPTSVTTTICDEVPIVTDRNIQCNLEL